MSSYSEKLKDPRWQRKRLEVMQRDGFACVLCNDKSSTLHVHHRVYDPGDPWETETWKLETLCYTCHETEHLSWKPAVAELGQILAIAGLDSMSLDDLNLHCRSAMSRMAVKPGFRKTELEGDIYRAILAVFLKHADNLDLEGST